jgi:hypothetical protein
MGRYVLHYQGNADPSVQEEDDWLSALGSVNVIDRLPGSLLVDATEPDLATLVTQYTNWSFSREKRAAVTPPRKRVVAPAQSAPPHGRPKK